MVAATQNLRTLYGHKLLLVEDNFLVAHDLLQMLQQMGCDVVGPAASVQDGIRLAEDETITGAILDINLQDGDCSPIATKLKERNCPFFFVTGFASPVLQVRELKSVYRLHKPVVSEDLMTAIQNHLISHDLH